MSTLTVPDVLLQAADLVDAGWAREVWEEHGCYCLVGAIRQALGTMTLPDPCTPEVRALIDVESNAIVAVRQRLSDLGYARGPINWNDEEGRTQAEVSALLRETAQAVG